MGDRATGLGGNSDLKVSPELAEMDLGIGNMVSMPRREDKIVLGPDSALCCLRRGMGHISREATVRASLRNPGSQDWRDRSCTA